MKILILGSRMGLAFCIFNKLPGEVLQLILDHLGVARAKMEFFLPRGGGVGDLEGGKTCFLSSKT